MSLNLRFRADSIPTSPTVLKGRLGDVHIPVRVVAPTFKRWIRLWEITIPNLIAVIGVLHGPDGAWVNIRRDDDRVKPSFGFRFLEIVILDPQHQPVPMLWQVTISSSLPSIEISKPWASSI